MTHQPAADDENLPGLVDEAIPEGSDDVDPERHASWLELFFDLLFVAMVAQLVHVLLDSPKVGTLADVAALFVAAWWAWGTFVLVSNLSGELGYRQRVISLSYMACMLLMAGGAQEAFHGHPALFAVGYALSRLVNIALWRTMRRRHALVYVPIVISALLWLVSAFTGFPAAYV